MSKRFFLALSIVFLGLSVLSDAEASSLQGNVVNCVWYIGRCFYFGTDGKIHNTDWTVYDTPPYPITGISGIMPEVPAKWYKTGTGYELISTFPDNPWNLSVSNEWDPIMWRFYVWWLINGELYKRDLFYWTVYRVHKSPSWIKDFTRPDNWPDTKYILTDGTSNVCPGNDNAKIWHIQKFWTVCEKTDGSFWSNISGFSVPSGSKIYWVDDNNNPGYCWTTSDNSLGCVGIGYPAGKWRDVAISTSNYACGVEYDTNLVKCWNNSGTIISTSSTESGGKPIPPPTPGTGFAKAGMSCVADRYPKIASTSWINPGFMNWQGTFTQTTYTGKSPYGCTGWLGNDCGDIIYGIGKSTDGVAVDYIKLYNFDAESVIRADSWKPPTVAVWPRSTLIADYHEPQILQIQAVRNGENYSANVFEFSNVANPSSVEPWANYFDDASKKWLPVYASGGLAKIPLANGQTKLFLSLREFTVPPIGFRMWYSAEYYDQVSCSTPTNPCKMTLVGANWECRGGYANGYYGQCAYDTDGACSPIVSTGGTVSDGVPEEGAVVIKDSSGNVVSVRPKWSAIQDGRGIDANKVFSCPDYKGFLDIFPCAVTIAGNVVELISQSVTGADGNGGIQKIGTDIGSGATATGGVSLTPVDADSDNLADYMFRHSWNRATNSELATPFTNWGKFALYGALFVALLGVLATIAFVNRNR